MPRLHEMCRSAKVHANITNAAVCSQAAERFIFAENPVDIREGMSAGTVGRVSCSFRSLAPVFRVHFPQTGRK